MNQTYRRQVRSVLIAAVFAALLTSSPLSAQESPTNATGERVSQFGGRAYLGRNAPVVGATVLVLPEDRSGEAYLTSTDERGIFRVDGLPDGSYSVRVEREGLAAKSKDGIPLKFPFRAVVELEMGPLAPGSNETGSATPVAAAEGMFDLRGWVVEARAGPLGEIRLRFVRPDGREDPRELLSLPDGKFEMGGAAAGVWRVEVGGVGYLSQRMALDLRGDTFLKVILVRQPPDYDPTPLELMPPEQPIPPPGLADDVVGRGGSDADPNAGDGGSH